jgi:hypothetical protein
MMNEKQHALSFIIPHSYFIISFFILLILSILLIPSLPRLPILPATVSIFVCFCGRISRRVMPAQIEA